MRRFDFIDFAIVAVLLVAGMVALAVATEDVTGPTVTAWSYTPTAVVTTDGPQAITVSMTITDALTGFNKGTICLRAANNGSQTQFIGFTTAQKTSGTINNGTYVVTATLPQYANVGAWKIAYLEMSDITGNSTVLYLGNALFGTYSTLRTQ